MEGGGGGGAGEVEDAQGTRAYGVEASLDGESLAPRRTFVRSLPQVHTSLSASCSLSPTFIYIYTHGEKEARRGNVEAVRQLLEGGQAQVDEEVVGETALHLACFYGHLPVVAYLLSRPDCRLNKRNLAGDSNPRPGVMEETNPLPTKATLH